MAAYTIVSVADVPNQAAEVGMDPQHFEIRFLRESLDLRNFSVTFERFGGGWQPPQGHPQPAVRTEGHARIIRCPLRTAKVSGPGRFLLGAGGTSRFPQTPSTGPRSARTIATRWAVQGSNLRPWD